MDFLNWMDDRFFTEIRCRGGYVKIITDNQFKKQDVTVRKYQLSSL